MSRITDGGVWGVVVDPGRTQLRVASSAVVDALDGAVVADALGIWRLLRDSASASS